MTANATMLKFNYPDTLLREYENWVVLLRPQQVTVGSVVLACKLDAEALSEVSSAAFTELATVTSELEATLRSVFAYDKINYLLLMMVDKHVHFHVLPRYSNPRSIGDETYLDASWPGPPDLTKVLELSSGQNAALLQLLRERWSTSTHRQ